MTECVHSECFPLLTWGNFDRYWRLRLGFDECRTERFGLLGYQAILLHRTPFYSKCGICRQDSEMDRWAIQRCGRCKLVGGGGWWEARRGCCPRVLLQRVRGAGSGGCGFPRGLKVTVVVDRDPACNRLAGLMGLGSLSHCAHPSLV